MNYFFSIVVTNVGEVYSWGNNAFGQLGIENYDNQLSPTLVSSLLSTPIRCISCGHNFSVAISKTHEVYSWGNNSDGELGNGDNENQDTPVSISSLNDKQVASIICGADYAFAITESKSVYSWGWNLLGQLGLGNTVSQSTPQLVSSLNDKNIIQISCGGYHTLAVSDDGKLYAWGGNDCGQLGVGNKQDVLSSPQLITDFNMYTVRACCGSYFSVVYTSDHRLYACGSNNKGQLGLGHQQDRWNLEPVLMDKIPMTSIACGYAHVAVLTADSRIYTWGYNAHGELGLGDVNDRNTPQPVEQINDKLVSIACGFYHTAALTETGNLYVWGENQDGCLGIGSIESQNKPHLLSLGEDKRVSMLWNCPIKAPT